MPKLTDTELDAWLAEYLFNFPGTAMHQSNPSKYRWGENLGTEIEPPAKYSSTGDGMLQVLEALRKRGFEIDLDWRMPDPSSLYEMQHKDEGWSASVTRGRMGYGGSHFYVSLPRAVADCARNALLQTGGITNAYDGRR